MIPQDTSPKPRDDVNDESTRMGDSPDASTGKPDISSPIRWSSISPDTDDDNVFILYPFSPGFQPEREVNFHRRNATVNITEVEWNTVTLSKDRHWDATSLSSANNTGIDGTRGVRNFGYDNTTGLGSVTLFLPSPDIRPGYGQNMSLAIHWITDLAHGVTYSELFTVVESEAAAEDVDTNIWEEFPEGWEDITPNTLPASQTRTTSIPSSTAGGETGNNVGAGSNSGEASDDGLSTGAIAGIAVGSAIAFLLLVTGLVWFFLLRRRRRPEPQEKALVQDDPQLDTTGAYAMNKEMSRVTESPHTPRSHFPGNDTTMASWPLTDQVNRALEERAFTPSASRQDVTRSGAGTPSGLHPNVAHLVEDGMTEDEIRRLEEEERQLDDEIERARRRR